MGIFMKENLQIRMGKKISVTLALVLSTSSLLSSCQFFVKREKTEVKEVLETHENYEIAKTNDDKVILKPKGDTISTEDWYSYYDNFASLIKAGDKTFIDYMRFIPDSNTNPAFLEAYPDLLTTWSETDLWKNAFKNFGLVEEFRKDMKKEGDATWSDTYLRWTRAHGKSFYEVGSSPYLVASYIDHDELRAIDYYNGGKGKEETSLENDEIISNSYAKMQELTEVPIITYGNELLVWSDMDDAFIFNGVEFMNIFGNFIPENPAFVSGEIKLIKDYVNFFSTHRNPPEDINVFYKTHIELFDQGRYQELYELITREKRKSNKFELNTEPIKEATEALKDIDLPRLNNFPADTKDFSISTVLPVKLNEKWYLMPYIAYGAYPENKELLQALGKSNNYSFTHMVEDYLSKIAYTESQILTVEEFSNFNAVVKKK